MIDINELRQSAQAATPGPWYIGSGTYEVRNIYSVESVTDDEGFTYNPVVATAEDDDVVCWEANARLIAAANPATISELLDRLEAAESECLEQARLNGMGAEREAALLAKLEAAEKERDDVAQQLEQSEQGKRKISKECDAMRAMLRAALDVLEDVKGNINPERGYADELEVDIEHAITTITSLAQRKTP